LEGINAFLVDEEEVVLVFLIEEVCGGVEVAITEFLVEVCLVFLLLSLLPLGAHELLGG
jgi:hypothetical protein